MQNCSSVEAMMCVCVDHIDCLVNIYCSARSDTWRLSIHSSTLCLLSFGGFRKRWGTSAQAFRSRSEPVMVAEVEEEKKATDDGKRKGLRLGKKFKRGGEDQRTLHEREWEEAFEPSPWTPCCPFPNWNLVVCQLQPQTLLDR